MCTHTHYVRFKPFFLQKSIPRCHTSPAHLFPSSIVLFLGGGEALKAPEKFSKKIKGGAENGWKKVIIQVEITRPYGTRLISGGLRRYPGLKPLRQRGLQEGAS